MAAAVDVDLASGASNIYSLIAGSFIIWQGLVYSILNHYFRILRIPPLLSFGCELSTRLLQCESLVLFLLR